jgi:hypothetical protein
MIELLQKKRRSPYDVELLMKMTARMQYFQLINSKKSNQENELHKKIC